MLKTIAGLETEPELLSGGAVLPCQIYPAMASRPTFSGERLLLLAILADAINIYLKGCTDRQLFEQTKSWIISDSRESQPFTFEQICEALGFNSSALRQRLVQLRTASPPTVRHKTLTLKSSGRMRQRLGQAVAPRRSRRGATAAPLTDQPQMKQARH